MSLEADVDPLDRQPGGKGGLQHRLARLESNLVEHKVRGAHFGDAAVDSLQAQLVGQCGR